MKLKPLEDDKQLHGYIFWCPACQQSHVFYTAGHLVWNFDGNMEEPTFSPSLRLSDSPDEGKTFNTRCHLVLTKGIINYCGDCRHDMKNQSVPLPDFPEGET